MNKEESVEEDKFFAPIHGEEGEDDHDEESVDIGKLLLRELLTRERPNQPFSPQSAMLSFVTWCHGNRTYELLHSVFGFPSRQALWARFHSEIDRTMNDLSVPEGIVRNILEFTKAHAIDVLHANLGVDAFSVVSEGDGDDHGCFLFLLQPFEFKLKPFPIRITFYAHGSADRVVQTWVNEVLDICERSSVVVHFVCTDGDPGSSARHKEFFLGWFTIFTSQGFDATLAWLLQKTSPIPALDLLHLMKNMRNKLVSHPIAMNPRSLVNVFDCDSIQTILNLGDVLEDKSTIGRMRDCYAIKLFTFENAERCLLANKPACTVYLFIFALLYSCLHMINISISQRLFRSRLAFELLSSLLALNDFGHLKEVTGSWSKKSEALTLASDGTWIKIMNTVVGMILFLQLNSESGCGDRFGTHPLENFIGLIRRLCCGDDRQANVRRAVAKTILAKQFMQRMSISVEHRMRENCGGVTFAFDSADPNNESIDLFDGPRFVAELLTYAGLTSDFDGSRMEYPRDNSLRDSLLARIRMLTDIAPTIRHAESMGLDDKLRLKNRTGNSRIAARNMQSQDGIKKEAKPEEEE
jgi:hypothetical protein